jgi:23S rRNA (uracil1939-C5)-methyltransferase
MRLEVDITRLGAQGDGVAETPEGTVYLPFTLPGERVLADMTASRGAPVEILRAAPDRVPPVCIHFGACGGCALQHLGWQPYLEWKRERVVEALAAQRIDAEVAPVRAFAVSSRRRAAFTAVKVGRDLAFGFRRALSHDIIDISQCPILTPGLQAALPALRMLCAALISQGEARILVTACDNGLDMLIEPEGRQQPVMTPAVAALAREAGIVRLAWRSDVLFSIAPARVMLAGVPVELPPGAFLQAVPEAEAVMAALIGEAVGKAKTIADLFAGLGTFTLALARRAKVTAVETDTAMLAALAAAVRQASGLKPVTTLRRDLFREPLSPAELNGFDAVVFDPPRAGAIAQTQALAKSKVRRVVAVSCNPASFARDARALIDGGYRIGRVTLIDQFVFSPHVELVASFVRT